MTLTTSPVLLIAVAALAGTQTPSDPPLNEPLDALLAETGSPGAGLVRDCGDGAQIAVNGARIARSQAAIEADDLWHLGSNTKAMTATLAARLVDQGLVGWDATIGDILAEPGFEISPKLADATLEELLSHRSGMMGNPGVLTSIRLMGADDERDLDADRIAYARAVLGEAETERGTFLYSNAGYVIASLILEAVGGDSYEALMQREVFDPLGMDSAGWGPPGVAGEADQPRGHRPGFFGGLSAREPGASADNPPAANAAGRAHMNLEDMGLFLRAHIEQDERYLSAQSWAQLHTAPEGGRYALGWGVGRDGSLGHSGSNTMWYMQMSIDPASGCAVAVAVNDGRIDTVSGPIRTLVDQLITR